MIDPFEQLKNRYLSSFEDKYLLIKKALDNKDHPTLCYLIHQLAGSSGSYGVDDVCEACTHLEQLLQQNETVNKTVQHKTIELLELINQAKT